MARDKPDPVERITEFNGIELAAARAKLPRGKFQIDSGGDRFALGAWSPRRGFRHSTVLKKDAAIVSMLGFEMPGQEFGLIYSEGANVFGERNVAEQS